MPDPTQPLVDALRRRIADPGAHLPRDHDEDDGERIYETIPTWSARAVAAGLTDGTLGYIPAVQLAEAQHEIQRQEALLTQAYDHNVDIQDNHEQLTAQRDRFKAELAAVRDAAWRQKQALDAERTQWLAEIASLIALIAPYDDEAVISIGLIRKALREGPASVPGSSRRVQEPGERVLLVEIRLAIRQGLMAYPNHLSEGMDAAAMAVARLLDQRAAGESQASEPAPAAPKLATGGTVGRPIDLNDRTVSPAQPARSTKFQDAVHGPRDWLSFRAGSGRQHSGERSDNCPGDGIPGHRHDISCIRPPSPPKPPAGRPQTFA